MSSIDGLARVERGIRVLEDHGHLHAQAAHPGWLFLAVMILAVELHLPEVGS
jgi:hypothetical protein